MKTSIINPFSRRSTTAQGLAVITLLLLPMVSLAEPGEGLWPGDPLMEGMLPPDGEMERPPPRGPHPAIALFDTDRSGDLSAAEVAAASAVLSALDLNHDGIIDETEAHESLPPPPPHRGRRGPPPGDFE